LAKRVTPISQGGGGAGEKKKVGAESSDEGQLASPAKINRKECDVEIVTVQGQPAGQETAETEKKRARMEKIALSRNDHSLADSGNGYGTAR